MSYCFAKKNHKAKLYTYHLKNVEISPKKGKVLWGSMSANLLGSKSITCLLPVRYILKTSPLCGVLLSLQMDYSNSFILLISNVKCVSAIY